MSPIRPQSPLVAVVTGASSGIGEGTARRLAREPGAQLVLVARREDRLRALAEELPAPATWVAADLTNPDAPGQVADHLREHHDGRLGLLVNNAGGGYRGTFADKGAEIVQRSMALNFDAVVRLTEALLPLLHGSAPSAIVNITSTAGRVARPGSGAYSAAKFALAGWSDSLRAEEHRHGVHVGAVYPGFIKTEGFPAEELLAKAQTRWMVSDVDTCVEAIVDCGLHGKAERYVPRPYGALAVLRILAPGLVRRVIQGGAADVLSTSTTTERQPGV